MRKENDNNIELIKKLTLIIFISSAMPLSINSVVFTFSSLVSEVIK